MIEPARRLSCNTRFIFQLIGGFLAGSKCTINQITVAKTAPFKIAQRTIPNTHTVFWFPFQRYSEEIVPNSGVSVSSAVCPETHSWGARRGTHSRILQEPPNRVKCFRLFLFVAITLLKLCITIGFDFKFPSIRGFEPIDAKWIFSGVSFSFREMIHQIVKNALLNTSAFSRLLWQLFRNRLRYNGECFTAWTITLVTRLGEATLLHCSRSKQHTALTARFRCFETTVSHPLAREICANKSAFSHLSNITKIFFRRTHAYVQPLLNKNESHPPQV